MTEEKKNLYSDFICITNRHLVEGDFYDQIKRVVEKKPRLIILREKDLPEKEYEEMLGKCADICKGQVPLYAHTYINAAKNIGTKGVHLPMEQLRKLTLFDRDGWMKTLKIGASVHSVTEALEAQQLSVSYVTAGHVFATDCKKGLPGRGLTFLQQVCKSVTIPVYALGGIQEDNLRIVMKMGAAGGAMMSGFMRMKS
ncbi:MAG: thiamine phosphate synthase [Lachnospiraceae bacterium]|nr:thiamine phosphate synthase [Lachnospiraceae bacterium]